jgi:hypothetical protein
MVSSGLRFLLYFAYGSLLKGICGDLNNNFVEKVEKYLDGDTSLEKEIFEEIYEELPHAIPKLHEMARQKKIEPFSLENVRQYIFEVHGCEVMPSCAVISGVVKKIEPVKKEIIVDGHKEEIVVKYLPSLENTLNIGEKVYFHQGWLVPKL